MLYHVDTSGYRIPAEGISYKTLAYGDNSLLTEFRLKEGAALPAHSHPHEQAGYLVSGRIMLTVGTNTEEMVPGDAWCIPAGIKHRADILADSVAIEVFTPVREDYLP